MLRIATTWLTPDPRRAVEPDFEIIRDPCTGDREVYDREGRLRATFHEPMAEALFVEGCRRTRSVFDRDANRYRCGDINQMTREGK